VPETGLAFLVPAVRLRTEKGGLLMFEKKDEKETAKNDPAMTRPQFIQTLHGLVNGYAEMWDQGHVDKKHPEPATLSAWKTDFEKFLSHEPAK